MLFASDADFFGGGYGVYGGVLEFFDYVWFFGLGC